MGTCFAVFLWLFVLKEMPASIAGLGTMATPVMGLLFSWAQLGEQPTALEIVGMVAILVASALLFMRGLRESHPVVGLDAERPLAAAPSSIEMPGGGGR